MNSHASALICLTLLDLLSLKSLEITACACLTTIEITPNMNIPSNHDNIINTIIFHNSTTAGKISLRIGKIMQNRVE